VEVLDIDQKHSHRDLIGFRCHLPTEEKAMTPYRDPNASDDAAVKRQILMVLVGFAVTTAIIATILNIVI